MTIQNKQTFTKYLHFSFWRQESRCSNIPCSHFQNTSYSFLQCNSAPFLSHFKKKSYSRDYVVKKSWSHPLVCNKKKKKRWSPTAHQSQCCRNLLLCAGGASREVLHTAEEFTPAFQAEWRLWASWWTDGRCLWSSTQIQSIKTTRAKPWRTRNKKDSQEIN